MLKIKPIYYFAALLLFLIVYAISSREYFESLILPIYWTIHRPIAVDDHSTIIMSPFLKDDQDRPTYDSNFIRQKAFVSLLNENRPKAVINLSTEFSDAKIWETSDSLLVINRAGDAKSPKTREYSFTLLQPTELYYMQSSAPWGRNQRAFRYVPVAADSVSWQSDRALDPAINLIRSAYTKPGTIVRFRRGKEVTIDTFHIPIDNYNRAFINYYSNADNLSSGGMFGNNDSIGVWFNNPRNVYDSSEVALRWIEQKIQRYPNRPPNRKALKFDGRGAHVDCKNTSSLRITGNQITLEAWVYVTQWRNGWDLPDQCFIAKESYNYPAYARFGYELGFSEGGKLSFNIGGREWHTLNSKPGLMKTNTWYHLAGTYDGAVQKIYINGEAADSSIGRFSIGDAATTDLWIGSSQSKSEWNLNGVMEEVRIWKIARTQAQIRATMSDTLGPNYYASSDSGLMGYWRFDEGNGPIAHDKTNNGNNGTLVVDKWGYTAHIKQGPHHSANIKERDFSSIPPLKNKIVILGNYSSWERSSETGLYRSIIINLLNQDFIREITNENRFFIVSVWSIAFLWFGLKRFDKKILIAFFAVMGSSGLLLYSVLNSEKFTRSSFRVYGISIWEIDLLSLLPFLYAMFLVFYNVKYSRSAILAIASLIIIPVASYFSFSLFRLYFYPGDLLLVSTFSLLVFFPFEAAYERAGLFLETQRLNIELKTARDTQMGLLPKEDPILENYDVSGICMPANEVGGDYYDYIWLNSEQTKFGIAIADVSGKAMNAAMTAVMTSGMIYREINKEHSPKTILMDINKPLYLKTDKRMFTSMSFGVIDLKARTLTLSNAGQLQPILRRKDALEYIKVEGNRLPLGVLEEINYGEITKQLMPGDLLIFMTDGIPEAMNRERELFGFERIEQIILKMPMSLSSKEIARNLIAEASKFAGTAQQHDDMTVVVVKVL